MSKLKIKKGDTVVVITGEHKSADTQYKVISVDPKSNRVTLEGVTVKKHSKPSAKFPQGGIIDIPASLHVSNVKLIGSDGQPTRVGRRVDEKSGKLERYSIKSGEAIK